LLEFLTVVSRTETVEYAADQGAQAGKLALAAAWTGQVVTDFAGINLPISVTAWYSPASGAYGSGSGDTAWAVLGLYAMGEPIPTQTVAFLKSVQNADGGWSWNQWGTSGETQHTATVVQALLAAGEPVSSTHVISALGFIASARNADGGYSYMPPGASDVDTTSFVVQALLSAGQTPAGTWCSPVRCVYLQGVQQADGSFPGYSPIFATQEAIPALMHRPFGPRGSWVYDCHRWYLPDVSKEP
jgi:hypothetical protein